MAIVAMTQAMMGAREARIGEGKEQRSRWQTWFSIVPSQNGKRSEGYDRLAGM
jgi:hypothetical protein